MTFEGLSVEDTASRVMSIFGQCINYRIDNIYEDFVDEQERLRERSIRATKLEQALDKWKALLPLSM